MEVIDYLKSLKDQSDAHAADIANRLRKDQPDATPFTLSVGAPTGMSSAVTKGNVIGGIQRPYRVFRNVSSTFVGATLSPGQAAAVTDTLNMGMVYTITKIQLITLVAPSLNTTITIKSNGTTTFTKTMILSGLAVVGGLAEVLGLTTPLPADLTLPITLTCSASSGTYDMIVDGLLLPARGN